MSEQRIGPVLVEKVGNALEASSGLEGLLCSEIDLAAEAAIRSVFDELGLKEERKVRGAFVGPDDVEYPDEPRRRYVSEWRPVEQGDAQ